MPSNQFTVKDARYLLLTYSQAGPDFNYTEIETLFSTLHADCRIGRERHADGGIHYHVFVDFGRKYSTRRTSIFDIQGRHPNIKKVGRTPWCAYDYVEKEGDVVGGSATRPAETNPGGSDESKKSWEEIANADDADHYWELLRALQPRALCTNFGNLQKYADWKWRKTTPAYQHNEDFEFNMEGHSNVVEWKETNIPWERMYVLFFLANASGPPLAGGPPPLGEFLTGVFQ